MLACTEAELQVLVNRLDSVSKRYSLLINVDKTKTMATNGATCSIKINSDTLEQVTVFPYLGSLITDDSECSKEIHARLAKGRSIGTKLKKIWQSHGIHTSTKIRLMKALVWPVALYGCESWTLKKTDEARINAFEMKCLRQLLRVSWTDRKTNEWVLASCDSGCGQKPSHLCEGKETGILWACHEEARGLLGEDANARHHTRRSGSWQTQDKLVEQHHIMDRTLNGAVSEDCGKQTPMENGDS